DAPGLPCPAALAEAARYQYSIHVLEKRPRSPLLAYFGIDPIEVDPDFVGDAAVGERLDERLISVLEAGIFADNGDRHIAFRVANALVDEAPAREIRLAFRLDPERRQHFTIEPRLVIGFGHRVDIVHVARFDDRARAHIAEQRELCAFALGNRPLSAAQ